MIRLVFRAGGLALLAAAIVAIAIDAARSIAASRVVLGSLGELWPAIDTTFHRILHLAVTGEAAAVPDATTAPLLALPASIALVAGGFILLFLGAPRRRRAYS